MPAYTFTQARDIDNHTNATPFYRIYVTKPTQSLSIFEYRSQLYIDIAEGLKNTSLSLSPLLINDNEFTITVVKMNIYDEIRDQIIHHINNIKTISDTFISDVMTTTAHKCSECSDSETSALYRTHDDKTYCYTCYGDKLVKCYHCATIVKKDTATEHNNRFYCTDCVDTIPVCASCGERITGSTREYNDEIYCRDCYNERFIRCCDCGHTENRDDCSGSYVSDDYYCCDCCSSCSNCGEIFRNNDLNSNNYCSDCASECEAIKDYMYKPDPIFNKTKKDSNKEPFIGFELEVQNTDISDDRLNDHAKTISENELLYCKHDGSVDDGFEIVSHPATLAYHAESRKEKYKPIFALSKNGFTSHNNECCGLHFHISKKELSSIDIYKIQKLVYENPKWFLLFSRRVTTRYCKMDSTDLQDRLCIAKRKLSDDRYVAVNVTRHTVEIRIFRGTLKETTFFAAMQLTHAMYNFVKRESIKNMTSKALIEYLNKNKQIYGDCLAYIADIFNEEK